VSNDGVVYVADRTHNRVQTFTTEGKFLKQARISVDGGVTPVPAGFAFSADKQQRYLYVGMTRRHMERQFRQVVGMTPKRLARIARFQRAVRFLEGDGDAGRQGGAVTAAACGYADQAHFIRDFRDLAGCPPTQHLLSKGVLTGFFTR